MSSSIKLDEKTAIQKMLGWVLLVKQDPVAVESPGGIAFGEEKIYKDELSQTRGTVVLIGEYAWHDESAPRCQVGDRILFRQYTGELLDSPDKYRIINDKDVYGLLEPLSAQE